VSSFERIKLPFISLVHGIDKKKGHHVLMSMLDPRLKNMRLITLYVSCENALRLVVDYESQLLLPLLLNLFKSLMLNVIEEYQVLGSQMDS
jgi:hypothetical protein